MITAVKIKNFGNIVDFQCHDIGKINFIHGQTNSGKTFILKSIYVAIKSIEEYGRGNSNRTIKSILSEKLYWTFQVTRLGELVNMKMKNSLSFEIQDGENYFKYDFNKKTNRKIVSFENSFPQRKSNSIFIPFKEVLSLQNIIFQSRDTDKVFGFDDTYYNLACALNNCHAYVKKHNEFSSICAQLENMIGGRLQYDKNLGCWSFMQGRSEIQINIVSESILKMASLAALLRNSYLDDESIIFIDGLEHSLDMSNIKTFLKIIEQLSMIGLQFFFTVTHDFFVEQIRKIAYDERIKITTLKL